MRRSFCDCYVDTDIDDFFCRQVTHAELAERLLHVLRVYEMLPQFDTI